MGETTPLRIRSNQRLLTMKTPIQSIKKLQDLLLSNQFDLTKWGQDGTKSVSDLWHEIETGESEIQTSPMQRKVSVVRVLIRRDNLILKETNQLMRDGSIRIRNKPPSEKMKPGENHLKAAIRCLAEELNIRPADIALKSETYVQENISDSSPSYPGLNSVYVIHSIEAAVAGLPTSSFWTDEVSTNQTDPVRTHCWDWVES